MNVFVADRSLVAMNAVAELVDITFMQPGGPSALPGTLAVFTPESAIIYT